MSSSRLRPSPGPSILLLALALAGCAVPKAVQPPPVVATLPPPPPAMPLGGYAGMTIPEKRVDGRYVTPNIDMTPAAAVWHLRGALNVAALACDQAGGGTVDPYNTWLREHGPALDANVRQYMHEWETTGWSDWQDAYDNAQTRLYNFYSEPALRRAFCAVAREELAVVGAVPDAELAVHARAALARLDRPFIDFFTAFDKWRDFYNVQPPKVVPTIPDALIVAAPPADAAVPVSPGAVTTAVAPVES